MLLWQSDNIVTVNATVYREVLLSNIRILWQIAYCDTVIIPQQSHYYPIFIVPQIQSGCCNGKEMWVLVVLNLRHQFNGIFDINTYIIDGNEREGGEGWGEGWREGEREREREREREAARALVRFAHRVCFSHLGSLGWNCGESTPHSLISRPLLSYVHTILRGGGLGNKSVTDKRQVSK